MSDEFDALLELLTYKGRWDLAMLLIATAIEVGKEDEDEALCLLPLIDRVIDSLRKRRRT